MTRVKTQITDERIVLVLLRLALSLHELEAGGVDIPDWVDQIWQSITEHQVNENWK